MVIVGRQLVELRLKCGWTRSALLAACQQQIGSQRLEKIEQGVVGCTEVEFDLLVLAMGGQTESVHFAVERELLALLTGVPLPDFRMQSPVLRINVLNFASVRDPLLYPVQGMLTAAAQANTEWPNELLIGHALLMTCANVCGLEPLRCWQRLARLVIEPNTR